MKTKPTQHAVRALNATGVQPDFLVARSSEDIDNVRREKIALYCQYQDRKRYFRTRRGKHL